MTNDDIKKKTSQPSQTEPTRLRHKEPKAIQGTLEPNDLARYLEANVPLEAHPPLDLMFLQDMRLKNAFEVANFLRS